MARVRPAPPALAGWLAARGFAAGGTVKCGRLSLRSQMVPGGSIPAFAITTWSLRLKWLRQSWPMTDARLPVSVGRVADDTSPHHSPAADRPAGEQPPHAAD